MGRRAVVQSYVDGSHRRCIIEYRNNRACKQGKFCCSAGKQAVGSRLELIRGELEELVQLQEALQSWGRSYVQDRLSLMRDGLYADNGNRLSKDEYSEHLRADHAAVSLLASRVSCEELRGQITEMMQKSIALTNNVEEINRIMDATIVLLSGCIERVGQEIRLKREELSKLL